MGFFMNNNSIMDDLLCALGFNSNVLPSIESKH